MGSKGKVTGAHTSPYAAQKEGEKTQEDERVFTLGTGTYLIMYARGCERRHIYYSDRKQRI